MSRSRPVWPTGSPRASAEHSWPNCHHSNKPTRRPIGSTTPSKPWAWRAAPPSLRELPLRPQLHRSDPDQTAMDDDGGGTSCGVCGEMAGYCRCRRTDDLRQLLSELYSDTPRRNPSVAGSALTRPVPGNGATGAGRSDPGPITGARHQCARGRTEQRSRRRPIPPVASQEPASAPQPAAAGHASISWIWVVRARGWSG